MLICILYSFDWGSFLASLAALITAIGTIAMVSEIKRQRQQSSMPDIFLTSETRFFLYMSSRRSGYYYSIWHDNRVITQNEVDSIRQYTYGINAINIGLGNAKYLKCDYSFDGPSVVSFINGFGIVNISELDIENVSYKGTIEHVVLGFDGKKNDLYFEYDFVLQNAKESIKIMLPEIYLHLFSAFIFSTLDISMATYRDKFPPLFLNIVYMDIKQKEYRKEFLISLNYDSVSPTLPSPNVSGLIKVKEVKTYFH